MAMAAGLVSANISPTFVSSDLFSPLQAGRITTPSISKQPMQVPPPGGKTWGEQLTTYGGIGKLPFLGQTRPRDLFVPRSHRHYISGFTKQLPKSTEVHYNAREYADSSYGICREPAYFSHASIHEVFPRHDHNRKGKQGLPKLTPATRTALQNYYNDLYYIPRYHVMYRDNTDLVRQMYKKADRGEDEQTKSGEEDQREPVTGQDTKEQLCPCIWRAVQLEETTNEKKHIFSALDRYGTPSEQADDTVLESAPCQEPGWQPRSDSEDKVDGSTLPGLAPHWPPGDSYIFRKHFQLKEIPYPYPIWPCPKGHRLPAQQCDEDCSLSHVCYCTSSKYAKPTNLVPLIDRDQRRSLVPPLEKQQPAEDECATLCRQQKTQEDRDTYARTRGFSTYQDFLNSFLPVKLGNLGNAGPQDYSDLIAAATQGKLRRRLGDGTSHLPPLRPPHMTDTREALIRGPPLNFRSEAHKRFHRLHPETVPDLRDHHIKKKKYFFYNYHSSAFRGGGIDWTPDVTSASADIS